MLTQFTTKKTRPGLMNPGLQLQGEEPPSISLPFQASRRPLGVYDVPRNLAANGSVHLTPTKALAGRVCRQCALNFPSGKPHGVEVLPFGRTLSTPITFGGSSPHNP
jgi:hypothetical protein